MPWCNCGLNDSALSLVAVDSASVPEAWNSAEQAVAVETRERISLREELAALADEWVAAAQNEQEKKALQATKEELLAALDEGK